MSYAEQLLAKSLGDSFTKLPQIDPWARQSRGVDNEGVRRILALPPVPDATPTPTMLEMVSTLEDVVLPRPTAKRIIKAVSEATGITISDILSPRRSNSVVRARHIAIYIIREYTRKSLPEIGRHTNRDHSTIIHALRCVEAKRDYYEPELTKVLKQFAPPENIPFSDEVRAA
jgi:hypothetical protein